MGSSLKEAAVEPGSRYKNNPDGRRKKSEAGQAHRPAPNGTQRSRASVLAGLNVHGGLSVLHLNLPQSQDDRAVGFLERWDFVCLFPHLLRYKYMKRSRLGNGEWQGG